MPCVLFVAVMGVALYNLNYRGFIFKMEQFVAVSSALKAPDAIEIDTASAKLCNFLFLLNLVSMKNQRK
jgi:hypothetical protein